MVKNVPVELPYCRFALLISRPVSKAVWQSETHPVYRHRRFSRNFCSRSVKEAIEIPTTFNCRPGNDEKKEKSGSRRPAVNC